MSASRMRQLRPVAVTLRCDNEVAGCDIFDLTSIGGCYVKVLTPSKSD